MTRKHFEAAAQILADADLAREARATIAQDFAEYFATQNPNFDRDRFFAACGL
jgi:hypothetical protein